ncbi:hypothetical protein KY318_03670 [Candidatus Woesearchaeota archaeon]|nr:hypothetical protein [Candidatus Woesearchaeota archaeon]
MYSNLERLKGKAKHFKGFVAELNPQCEDAILAKLKHYLTNHETKLRRRVSGEVPPHELLETFTKDGLTLEIRVARLAVRFPSFETVLEQSVVGRIIYGPEKEYMRLELLPTDGVFVKESFFRELARVYSKNRTP